MKMIGFAFSALTLAGNAYSKNCTVQMHEYDTATNVVNQLEKDEMYLGLKGLKISPDKPHYKIVKASRDNSSFLEVHGPDFYIPFKEAYNTKSYESVLKKAIRFVNKQPCSGPAEKEIDIRGKQNKRMKCEERKLEVQTLLGQKGFYDIKYDVHNIYEGKYEGEVKNGNIKLQVDKKITSFTEVGLKQKPYFAVDKSFSYEGDPSNCVDISNDPVSIDRHGNEIGDQVVCKMKTNQIYWNGNYNYDIHHYQETVQFEANIFSFRKDGKAVVRTSDFVRESKVSNFEVIVDLENCSNHALKKDKKYVHSADRNSNSKELSSADDSKKSSESGANKQ